MATKTDIGGWLNNARQELAGKSHLAGLDAEVLLACLLGKPRAWILAHPEAPLSTAQQKYLRMGLDSLSRGVPLPYLTGIQEFYGFPFRVGPQVLIPRPETELLVAQAIAWLDLHPEKRWGADVGSGSGCIAITLVKMVMGLRMIATDISRAALRGTHDNLSLHRVAHKVGVVQTSLLEPFGPVFDLICANLPYIPNHKLAELPVARHEPVLALDGGPDGLDLICALLAQAPQRILPGGLLLLEIEAGQESSALELSQAAFPRAQAVVLPDLAGLPRLLRIELKD
jgi:release factor glutamine methyltransferase